VKGNELRKNIYNKTQENKFFPKKSCISFILKEGVFVQEKPLSIQKKPYHPVSPQ
jgi:hypothetical protein